MLFAALCVLLAPTSHSRESNAIAGARQTISNFERAWNSHDMALFASLFADDADFVNIEGTRWRGRAAIVDAHTFVHKTIFKQSRLTIDDTTFKQLSPDIVVARTTLHIEGQTTMQGKPVPGRKAILTNVLVHSGSTWKIVVTQNTLIDS